VTSYPIDGSDDPWKWVLLQILRTPPPPAAPNVPSLKHDETTKNLTMPSTHELPTGPSHLAACHRMMIRSARA